MFGLEQFKESPLGRRVGSVLEDPRQIADMVVFSRHGMPAVQAVGKQLLTLGPEVRQDQVKKTIGRWVREILHRQGWTVARKRRVAPGNLFSTGAVYRPAARTIGNDDPPDAPRPRSPAERAAAWRAAAKGLPHTEPLSDEAMRRETIYAGRG